MTIFQFSFNCHLSEPKTKPSASESNFSRENYPSEEKIPDLIETNRKDRTKPRKDFFRTLLDSGSDEEMDIKVFYIFYLTI